MLPLVAGTVSTQDRKAQAVTGVGLASVGVYAAVADRDCVYHWISLVDGQCAWRTTDGTRSGWIASGLRLTGEETRAVGSSAGLGSPARRARSTPPPPRSRRSRTPGAGSGARRRGRLATPRIGPALSQYSVSVRLDVERSIPRRVPGPGQSGDTEGEGRCSGGLAAVPSWYARAGRGPGSNQAELISLGAGVATAGVLFWRDPPGSHAPPVPGCPGDNDDPAVGGGRAWVESWAYPARPDRSANEPGCFSLYSCYRCPDRFRRPRARMYPIPEAQARIAFFPRPALRRGLSCFWRPVGDVLRLPRRMDQSRRLVAFECRARSHGRGGGGLD